MNLEEYPTPLTDAWSFNGFPPSGALGMSFSCVDSNRVRDLERRLTVCRNALKDIADMNEYCTVDIAEHALKLIIP